MSDRRKRVRVGVALLAGSAAIAGGFVGSAAANDEAGWTAKPEVTYNNDSGAHKVDLTSKQYTVPGAGSPMRQLAAWLIDRQATTAVVRVAQPYGALTGVAQVVFGYNLPASLAEPELDDVAKEKATALSGDVSKGGGRTYDCVIASGTCKRDDSKAPLSTNPSAGQSGHVYMTYVAPGKARKRSGGQHR